MNPRVTSELHPVGTHLPVIEDKETTRVRIVCYSVTIYGGMGNNSFLPEPKLSKMFFYALYAFPQLSCGPGRRSDGKISYKLPWQGKTPSCGGGGYTSLDLQTSMKQ